MTTPPPITRSGAQHDARHELSKAIYHRQSDPWPVRAVKWGSHLIDRILNATFDHAPAGNGGALALIAIVVALVVVIIWRVGIPRRANVAGVVLAGDSILSAAEHRRLAEAAGASDDWHTAVIERMRALARELEERSVLVPRAGRTATELAQEAAAVVPMITALLRDAADTFNAVAYGEQTATAADSDRLAAADDAVRQASRSQVVAV